MSINDKIRLMEIKLEFEKERAAIKRQHEEEMTRILLDRMEAINDFQRTQVTAMLVDRIERVAEAKAAARGAKEARRPRA